MDRLLSAPESLAQSVLVALCDDSRVQARALKYLGELEDFAAQRAAVPTTAAAAAGSSSSANSLKRQSPMEPGQICLQCERAFIPSGNAAKACLYHPGDLELDDEHETWADWDEHVGGPMDSSENQEEHPEAFLWGQLFSTASATFTTPIFHSLQAKRNTYIPDQALELLTFLPAMLQIVVTGMVLSPGAPRGIMWRSEGWLPKNCGWEGRLTKIA